MLLNITIITTLICQTYEICSFEMSLNNGSFYLNHSIFILLCQQMKNIRNYYYGFIVCVCICLSFCSSVCSCFPWRIIFVLFFIVILHICGCIYFLIAFYCCTRIPFFLPTNQHFEALSIFTCLFLFL